MSIPVLMYHAIGSGSSSTQQYDDADFVVSENNFKAQLSYLKDNGFSSCRLDDVPSLLLATNRKVIISFDDGHASDVSIALPLLQEYGFSAEFFFTSNWIGQEGYVDEEGIRALHSAGMGIGSHGVTHQFFNDFSFSAAEDELVRSTESLSNIISAPVDRFSAPGGRLPDELEKLMALCGIKYVCTSEIDTCNSNNFPLEVPRIAIRNDTSIELFEKIVNADAAYYRRHQVRKSALVLLRTVLGNQRYMNMREKLLQLRP
ncbi:MAG: polysaccharide deacetylase family protein [Pseudomonadales bacterium]